MSIYLGIDNSSNHVLHMTNRYESEEVMKSGVLDSTIFHSSMPYLQIIASYDVPVIKSDYGRTGPRFTFTAECPNAAIDLVLAGYKFIVVLASTNSGGRKVIVNSAARFFRNGGDSSPKYNFGTSGAYGWGPTAAAASWMENPADYPSYTNRYIYLSDHMNSTDPFLLTYNYRGYSADNVIGNTASVYFFNIKNNDLEIVSNPRSISIDRDTFLIGTPYGDTDLSTFRPFRPVSSPTATSFSPRGSNINIQPYTIPTSPISSWIIDGTNSNAGSISKKLANGSVENFISNTSKNMILIDSLTRTFNITAPNNGTNSVELGLSAGSDEAVTVLFSGTFSHMVGSRAIGGHANFLTNNGGLVTVTYGSTTWLSNGAYRMNDYILQAGVVNGAVVLSARGIQTNPPTGYSGTFTGTAHILKFKIR